MPRRGNCHQQASDRQHGGQLQDDRQCASKYYSGRAVDKKRTCKDLKTGRVWSLATYSIPGGGSYENSSGYCANLVEGGQSDWRLPTIDELKAAYTDGGTSHLALNGYETAHMWSSSLAKPGGNYYALQFSNGDVGIFGTKAGSKYGWWHLPAICVR